MNSNFVLILLIFLFFARNISGQIMNPLNVVGRMIENIDAGINSIGHGIYDTINPAITTLRKVDEQVFGGINQGLFEIERGVVEGLNEVIGTPVALQDVNFFLVTSENMMDVKKMDFQHPIDLVNAKGQIFFIVHGFMSSRNTSWYPKLTEALLNRHPNSYVVQIDWSKPAASEYPFAAFTTESVGDIIAEFLYKLVKDYGVPVDNLVLTGHSLGGHVIGWAGQKFALMTGQKLPLLIAFDPAGPLFCLRPENRRLSKNDANIVKVIHSDGGKLGFLEPCGTIDYFPNGGSGQPGCAQIKNAQISSLINPFVCDHFRAYDYFIEALNKMGSYRARRCPSFTDFMFTYNCEDVESKLDVLDEIHTGTFFFQTNEASPFSIPLKPLF